jgi:hypothetical protein
MKDNIETPFTNNQVDCLNDYQFSGLFHPFTCKYDGDEKHIEYEFNKNHQGEDYQEYLKKEKDKGINYPEMEFNQTNLIATKDGWICPACDYKQNWAHSFMVETKQK